MSLQTATQGVCEKSIQDVVERFWDIIEEININKVLKFMRDNIVSKYNQLPLFFFFLNKLSWFIFIFTVSVVLLTALFWIPASTTISYVDRKKRRNDTKEYKWNNSLDLIHPSDRRRVIHIR